MGQGNTVLQLDDGHIRNTDPGEVVISVSIVFKVDGCSIHYMRTCGVNQEFRFGEDICFQRKSRQIRTKKLQKRPILHHTCAHCSELPSHISTMHVSF